MSHIVTPEFVVSQVAFEKVRQSLLQSAHPEVFDRRLVSLASAVDRNLPLALMDRTVDEILTSPFERLYDTPGVGPKKISGLLRVLQRAVTSEMDAGDDRPNCRTSNGESRSLDGAPNNRTTEVAEAIWGQWQSKVADLLPGDEPMGRYIRSLRDLPRSSWQTPLGRYYRLSLSEVRALPAHGCKRVVAVMTVFEDLHRLLSEAEALSCPVTQLLTPRVSELERWALDASRCAVSPTRQSIESGLVRPLIDQLEIDADSRLFEGAVRELKMHQIVSSPQPFSIGSAWGLTRFDRQKMRDIVQIRWPRGRGRIRALLDLDKSTVFPPAESRQYVARVAEFFFGEDLQAARQLPRHKNPSTNCCRRPPSATLKNRFASLNAEPRN